MIARITLVGHLGRDPEAKQTKGKELTTFSLATSSPIRGSQGEYKTTWWEVVTFGTLAAYVLKKGDKGGRAFVEGIFEKNEYLAKDGTAKTALRVIADTVTFLGKGGDDGGSDGGAKAGRGTEEVTTEDDIPF